MRVVWLIATFVFGFIVCYLLLSLELEDVVGGQRLTSQAPSLSLPTYLSFLNVLMTAVTAVLATLAIGIGLVAFFTFPEIRKEARKVAEKVAREQYSDDKINELITEVYSNRDTEEYNADEWGNDQNEKHER